MEVLKLIGQRLRQAREFLGLTQSEAAQQLGITREYLSQLETGHRRVPLRLLAKMAELYGYPESWFLGFSEPTGSFQLLLRAAKRTHLNRDMRRQLVKFVSLCEEIAKLRQILNQPAPELPTYPVTPERLEEQARRTAAAERERLGLGDRPVPDLADVLEAQGIAVIRLPLPEGTSGAMAYEQGKGGFILVNANEPPYRQLWTIAHEYAHLLKDRERGFQLPELVKEANGENGDEKRQFAERFAHRFAAHFLMPEEMMRNLVLSCGGSLDFWALIHLRRILGVSYPALLFRLRELGYLTAEEVTQLQRAPLPRVERVIYGAEERAENFPVSKTLWQLALEAALKGKITLSYAADFLGCSVPEVQDALAELEEAKETVELTGKRRG